MILLLSLNYVCSWYNVRKNSVLMKVCVCRPVCSRSSSAQAQKVCAARCKHTLLQYHLCIDV
jgi:hypothetical protein